MVGGFSGQVLYGAGCVRRVLWASDLWGGVCEGSLGKWFVGWGVWGRVLWASDLWGGVCGRRVLWASDLWGGECGGGFSGQVIYGVGVWREGSLGK